MAELRVLLVEDSQDDAELNLRELKRNGFSVSAHRVETAAGLIDALSEGDWDLVLSDFQLPGFGGFEALKILQTSERDIPFILVSGAIGEEIAVSVLKAGAHDCVQKGNLPRLGPVVDRELREARSRREKRETERRLREAEERYRDLFQHSPVPTWVGDFSMVKARFEALRADGVSSFRAYFDHHPECVRECVALLRIVDMNRMGLELLGASSIDELSAIKETLFEEVSWSSFREEVIALAEGARTFSSEIPIRDMRGGRRILSYYLTVSPGFEASLGRVLASFVDITERVEMEQLLKDSRASLEQAQRIAHLGSWEWDLNQERPSWSPQMFELFGLASDALPPTYDEFVMWIHPDDRPKVLGALEEVIASGNPWSVEYRIQRLDGSVRHVNERAELVLDDLDRPFRLRGAIQDITESWAVQEQLRQSETQMAAVLESTAEIIVTRDLEGRCVYFNQGFASIVPNLFHVEAVAGLRTMDYLPETAQAHWAEVFARVHEGHTHQEEFQWTHEDGQVAFYETAFKPIWQEGRIVGSLEVNHDITSRKASERALQTSEARLRHAAIATGFGVYEWRFESGKPFYSPEFLAIYGLAEDQELELDDDLVPTAVIAEDRDRYLSMVRASNVPQGDGILDMEFRITRTDGRRAWLRAQGRTLFADGRPIRANGVLQDISARRIAEVAMAQARADLDRFFASLPDPAGIVDAQEGIFIKVNSAWERLLGTPESELLNRSFVEWVHPDDLDATHRAMVQLAKGDSLPSFANRYMAPDGSYRWLEWSAPPSVDGKIFVMARDMTDRRRLESTLKDMERLSAKGQMAAYIAHEINNPLAGIKNAFALVERAIPPDHAYARYGDLIKREIDRIAGIIRTMYHVYRPPSLEAKPISIHQAFQDIEGLVEAKCRAAGVHLEIAMANPRLTVVMNEGMLRQVLFNLVLNAIDASPDGGRILLGAAEDSDSHLITVEDEGPGIDPALAQRIFEQGFTTKRDSAMSGLGLGLSTCRSILAASCGTLTFRSPDSGRGARFEMRVPDMIQETRSDHDSHG